MRNKKTMILLFIGIIALTFTGCSPSEEEQEQGKAYVEKYKEQITEYIKETYDKDSKVLNMKPSFSRNPGSVSPIPGRPYANGRIITEVKAKGEKFKVMYISDQDIYYTDKNKGKIEESLKNYIVDAMGEDKIVLIKLKYGVDPLYYSYGYFTDNNYTTFEQLYDNINIVSIECYLKDTDVAQLKESNTFSYLENLVLKGSNSYGHMGVWFVNIDQAKLEERDWNKIRYSNYVLEYIDEISTKFPNNTYHIKYTKIDSIERNIDNGGEELIRKFY